MKRYLTLFIFLLLFGCSQQQKNNNIPFFWIDGYLVVPVALQNAQKTKTVNLLVDTGCQLSFLTADVAGFFDLPPHKKAETMIFEENSPDHTKILMQYRKNAVFFDEIRIGNKTYNRQYFAYSYDYPASLMDNQKRIDGILGLDFLSQQKITINFENKTITWGEK